MIIIRLNFENIISLIKTTKNKPRTYIEKGQGGADNIDDTWSKVVWGEMLDTAGGANIADGTIPAGNYGQMSEEKILVSNPEYILITGSDWVNSNVAVVMGYGADSNVTNSRLLTYASRKGWNNLLAIKNNNLYAVHHGLARSLMDFAAIQFIAKQLHPDLFRDIDPNSELEEFHNKFLPVKFSGVWFWKAN